MNMERPTQAFYVLTERKREIIKRASIAWTKARKKQRMDEKLQ